MTTDEMAPAWFLPAQVPYDKMWADDIHWCGFEEKGPCLMRGAALSAQPPCLPGCRGAPAKPRSAGLCRPPDVLLLIFYTLPSLPPSRYPLFLQSKAVVGTFHFKDTHTLVEHTLREVPAASLHLPAEPL